ncbi:elongation factor 4 [candidate division WWE3 bacterium RIFCSPLOWO2_01_FULL_39_13]|uniref:Elongation factor 4 n=1 Tax=candidate division WWE3 bacterium RIFCSPLOWO2_01_FULL_39_13 TaxID=1802624 RepID=A0A1F4V571_UNCKA|nr:MAG: elongation factor 4 [candidate division WWE3 bacterium RIFCSPLOWO2_01_FULL_39_13]
MDVNHIRNFCIIAHIDHGKSTLADRLLEMTGSVETAKDQMLDSMDLEKERGITIKLKAVRMKYSCEGRKYELNLIDTPGHVDFEYEVSRSLAACEGAVLLVDASQGVQAQTIANLDKARRAGLIIIPVVNKIDLPYAMVDKSVEQLMDLGFKKDEISFISGKTGEGVKALIEKIIDVVPFPRTSSEISQALVFDSFYDEYRGVVVFVRVFGGEFKRRDDIKFIASKASSRITEIGYLSPKEVIVNEISDGQVGFIATGLKDLSKARVGDTISRVGESPSPVPGYKEPIPVVFLGFYPQDSSKYTELREAIQKLSLNDSAFTYEPENIGSVGRGFRCGFLGLLHADVVMERIKREYGIDIIATSPSVRYVVKLTNGEEIVVKSASEFPDPSYVKETLESWAEIDVYTSVKYIGSIMELCSSRRGKYVSTDYLGSERAKISYKIPLAEIIVDFYDKLKSVSSGYASLDYRINEYVPAEIARVDILAANDKIPPLSQLVQKKEAYDAGKRIVLKLKDLIPRQQFKVSLQAVIGGKVIAREDISPARKDVTGHLYGGDVTRKNKLLDKQKKGKSRMKRFGKVDIPQDVFWKVMER